jgi:APA family basic amino acid/polyamine antiporter
MAADSPAGTRPGMPGPGPCMKRTLGTFDAAMIVTGAIIGAGIFMNPAESARYLQNPAQLLFVWGAGGFVALLGAACFAELGAMFPRSGGQYVYLEKGFAPWTGFLFGWTLFSTIQTGALAAVSYTCARFIGHFVLLSDLETSFLAAALIGLLSLVNYLGIKPGSLVQNVFNSMKILALLALILIGLFWPRGSTPGLGSLFPGGFSMKMLSLMGLALMPALFSYGGWQNLNFVGGEVKNPSRSIPLAILSGVSLVVTVYMLSNLVYIRALPLGRIAGSTKLASDAMAALVGPGGAHFIALAIIVSTLGFLSVVILTGPRVYAAMAEEGAFLPLAARLHPRFGTPHYAIWMQSAWACGLLFTKTYGQLLEFVTFGDWIFFALTALALMALRRRRPDLPRPYRAWGYPVVPLLFFLIAAGVVVNVFLMSFLKSLIGLAIILAGLPLYFLTRARRPGGATRLSKP